MGTDALIARLAGWRDWLRAARHITIMLGFVLIAFAWGAAEFDLWRDRERAEQNALRTTNNFARVFEEQILRAIRYNDRIIQSLQQAAVNGTLEQEFARRAAQVNEAAVLTVQIAITSADGAVIASS